MQATQLSESGDFLGLRGWAESTPEALALASEGRAPLTYACLWRQIAAASKAMEDAGVPAGTVVVLALPTGAPFVTAALAIARRCACAPFDLANTEEESRHYLRRLRASALIFEEGTRHPIQEAARQLGMRLFATRPDPNARAGAFDLQPMNGGAGDAPWRQTDAAFVLQTSATTDVPKLVPLTAANVRAAAEQDARALELLPQDRFLSLMPLCHASGLYTLFTQLLAGGSVYCSGAFELTGFLSALETFRPTWFSAGPSVPRILLARDWQPGFFHRFPLRFARTAGAPLGAAEIAALEQLLRAPVLFAYGLTELIGATRSTPVLRKPGSVGKSIAAEIAILDDAGNLLSPGTEGEVVVRGPMLTSGYLDDPEANRAAFQNGWFRTGDLGRLDEEGYLFVTGRLKEIINRGGQKVIPTEVDGVLAAHPALAEVAAFGAPHWILGEEVAAAAVLREGAQVSELDLRHFAAQRLAPHKVPHRIVFVDNLPRTALGKPKRGVLAAKFRDLYSRNPSEIED